VSVCVREREREKREPEKTDGKSSLKRFDLFAHATVFVRRRKVCDEIQ